jgi:glycosidase
MSLIATVRGIPQFYYGDEIGMLGDKNAKGDGDIRRDFPGGWQGDASNAFTAQGRTDSQNNYYNFTKKLFNWRKSKDVIHNGKTMQFVPQNNVYVYFRYNDSERVMIVLNNSTDAQSLELSRFAEMIKESKYGQEILSGNKIEFNGTLKIEAKSSMIIELK